MKRVLSLITIILLLFFVVITPVYAESEVLEEKEVLESENASDFYKIKETANGKVEQYTEKYGSKAYGITAMILDTVRIYSIPFCFVGIAISAIYQYVLGIRKLDTRDKGFAIMISIITNCNKITDIYNNCTVLMRLLLSV